MEGAEDAVAEVAPAGKRRRSVAAAGGDVDSAQSSGGSSVGERTIRRAVWERGAVDVNRQALPIQNQDRRVQHLPYDHPRHTGMPTRGVWTAGTRSPIPHPLAVLDCATSVAGSTSALEAKSRHTSRHARVRGERIRVQLATAAPLHKEAHLDENERDQTRVTIGSSTGVCGDLNDGVATTLVNEM